MLQLRKLFRADGRPLTLAMLVEYFDQTARNIFRRATLDFPAVLHVNRLAVLEYSQRRRRRRKFHAVMLPDSANRGAILPGKYRGQMIGDNVMLQRQRHARAGAARGAAANGVNEH